MKKTDLPPDVRFLVETAEAARRSAYAPYSGFTVGAAVRAVSGMIYAGCNVENAAYNLGICAERCAVFHAVASGDRVFDTIAVVTANGVTPCGGCRQVLAEFNPRMGVIVADEAGNCRLYRLDELLPDAFTPEQLTRE